VEEDVTELLTEEHSYEEAVHITAITYIGKSHKLIANIYSRLFRLGCINSTYIINLSETVWIV
jgi:hypothetical protein